MFSSRDDGRVEEASRPASQPAGQTALPFFSLVSSFLLMQLSVHLGGQAADQRLKPLLGLE